MALAHSRSFSRARTLRRAAVVAAATTAAMLLFAGPALAHITVTPGSVPAGSGAVLTFHVPNEEAHADTVKVDVQISTDYPIAQLLVEPVPGWSISVRTITLAKPITTDDGTFNQAVSEVIWSGGQIRPGQFQNFAVSADPMPVGVSQLVFKAIQTYSDGNVVRWIDVPQPGQAAPVHPAPTVTLTTATAPARTAVVGSAPAGSGTDGLSRALAVAGLLVGLLAGLLSLMAVRQARRLTTGIGAGAGVGAASDPAAEANGQSGGRVPAGASASARRDQAPAGAKTSARRPQQRRRG